MIQKKLRTLDRSRAFSEFCPAGEHGTFEQDGIAFHNDGREVVKPPDAAAGQAGQDRTNPDVPGEDGREPTVVQPIVPSVTPSQTIVFPDEPGEQTPLPPAPAVGYDKMSLAQLNAAIAKLPAAPTAPFRSQRLALKWLGENGHITVPKAEA